MKRSPRDDRRGSRRDGLTLVEMMVALVVLSFGLLGVAAIQVRAITESSGGKHLSDASAIARNRVEALTRLAWADATLNDSGGAWTGSTTIDRTTIDGLDVSYTRTERVTDNVAAPDTTLKSIEVRVQWDDGKRANRSVVLASSRLRELDE